MLDYRENVTRALCLLHTACKWVGLIMRRQLLISTNFGWWADGALMLKEGHDSTKVLVVAFTSN